MRVKGTVFMIPFLFFSPTGSVTKIELSPTLFLLLFSSFLLFPLSYGFSFNMISVHHSCCSRRKRRTKLWHCSGSFQSMFHYNEGFHV
ncbi:hypothetical protein J3E68DRAFT_417596 [Trichoderma sp. SZMC 28012]